MPSGKVIVRVRMVVFFRFSWSREDPNLCANSRGSVPIARKSTSSGVLRDRFRWTDAGSACACPAPHRHLFVLFGCQPWLLASGSSASCCRVSGDKVHPVTGRRGLRGPVFGSGTPGPEPVAPDHRPARPIARGQGDRSCPRAHGSSHFVRTTCGSGGQPRAEARQHRTQEGRSTGFTRSLKYLAEG